MDVTFLVIDCVLTILALVNVSNVFYPETQYSKDEIPPMWPRVCTLLASLLLLATVSIPRVVFFAMFAMGNHDPSRALKHWKLRLLVLTIYIVTGCVMTLV